ncbi:MAG: hypothetical protein QOH64_2594 [Acidimicrobiaceae bacterium]
MSVTDQTMNGRTEVRGGPMDTFTSRRRETKLFAKTSEFWATLIGVVAVAVIYNAAADTSLDLFRACLLATMIGIGYIVSRGFAKAGSRDHRDVEASY